MKYSDIVKLFRVPHFEYSLIANICVHVQTDRCHGYPDFGSITPVRICFPLIYHPNKVDYWRQTLQIIILLVVLNAYEYVTMSIQYKKILSAINRYFVNNWCYYYLLLVVRNKYDYMMMSMQYNERMNMIILSATNIYFVNNLC